MKDKDSQIKLMTMIMDILLSAISIIFMVILFRNFRYYTSMDSSSPTNNFMTLFNWGSVIIMLVNAYTFYVYKKFKEEVKFPLINVIAIGSVFLNSIPLVIAIILFFVSIIKF
ncbi:MAG: hypothetical protein ACRC7R_04295 [Sarcina sp.]